MRISDFEREGGEKRGFVICPKIPNGAGWDKILGGGKEGRIRLKQKSESSFPVKSMVGNGMV